MSVAELKVIEGGKQTFRTVEVVRQAESDRWAIVEAIQADIDANPEASARAGANDNGVNKGREFAELCESIADACRAEGADAWKAKTVSTLYRVAVAWPPESRVANATYGAHERMFSREDRVARLTKLVERSSTGRVNRNDVDLWLSSTRTTHVLGFLDNIEKAVRSALVSKGKPWSHVHQDDRTEIARRLRFIANEIENSEGKFSK